MDNNDGPNTRILKNGAVYDMDKKRIISNPGGGTMGITQENASALSKLRWERAREAFAAGLVAGTPGLGKDDLDTEAWRAVGEHAARVFHATDTARGLADLGRFIAESAGYKADREQTNQQTGIILPNVDVLMDMLQALDSERERRRRVVDI